MKIFSFRLLMLTALLFCGNFHAFSQHAPVLEDLVLKAPGFDASKQLESIKNQSNGSNGLIFVAWYKKADVLHFRIDRNVNSDNSIIYTLFPDLNFSLIDDQMETTKIIQELTIPKTEIIKPTVKTE